MSLVQIGKHFGGRDHSTILHACKKIDRETEANPSFKRKIQTIKSELI
jgi:chromosomal replication initiator protein